VVLLNAEDSPEVTRARLATLDADLDMVHIFDWRSTDQAPRFEDRKSAETVEHAVSELKARLIVIDPIASFTAANLNADKGARPVMRTLGAIASRTDAAVVMVRHLRKTAGGPPQHRGSGSTSLFAAARSVLLVSRHPLDDDVRIVSVSKSSGSSPADSVQFRISDRRGHPVPECRGRSPFTASVLATLDGLRRGPALREAVDFLLDFLEDGAMQAKETEDEAVGGTSRGGHCGGLVNSWRSSPSTSISAAMVIGSGSCRRIHRS
jgi:hypothetical protein